MKELIEWMEQELKGHELIGSDYGLGLRSGIGRCIAKAKELEAANCDHKNCLNYSQYLRQNHSDDKLDMPEKVRIVGGEKERGITTQLPGIDSSQVIPSSPQMIREDRAEPTPSKLPPFQGGLLTDKVIRDPLAEAWDSEEDKIWDTLDMHTPKVDEKWRGVPPDGVFNNDYTDDYNLHIEPCQKSTPDS